MEIREKVILITGATGGIGSAIARTLASEGTNVVLAARSLESLEDLANEIPRAFAVRADVRKDEDVRNLVRQAIDRFGRIDALVNCAGQGMWSMVEHIDVDEYRELFDLNVCGYLRMMKEVIPVMRSNGGGSIVNVSSMLAKSFYPNLSGYSSTKYAVDSLSLSARTELGKDRIIVSVIRPKLVETDFGKHAVHPEPDTLRDRNNPSAPPMDTPEFVAEKIVELLRSGDAEMNL